MRLHGAAYSSQGGRPENQDDLGFVDTPLGFLFVICDGMGGGPGGKTASYIAKTTIARALGSCSPQMPVAQAFRNAASAAQAAITAKAAETASLHGMGSTFVAVLISERSAFIAHAGDSRCYRLQGKNILYRTADHSLVGSLVRKKTLTEEQARTSPRSNVITRGLGCLKNNTPDIKEVPYRKGDRFVLCTDGVWGIMPHEELISRLTVQSEEHLIVSSLGSYIDALGFKKGGGHDNHSLALITMDCDSRLKDRWYTSLSSLSTIASQLPMRKIAAVGAAVVLAAVVAVIVNVLPKKQAESEQQASAPPSTSGGGSGGYVGGECKPLAPQPRIENKTESPLNIPDTVIRIAELMEEQEQEAEEEKKKDEKDGRKDDKRANDNMQTTCQKLVNRLDTAKNYAGNKEKETIKEKERLLNEAIGFAKQIGSKFPEGSDINSRALGVADYIKRQEKVMLLVRLDNKTGKYVSCVDAIDALNTAEKKAKDLQDQIKEYIGKQETKQ